MIIKNKKTPVRKFTSDRDYDLTNGKEVVCLHKKYNDLFVDIGKHVDCLDSSLESTSQHLIHSKIGNFYVTKQLLEYLDAEMSWKTVSEINMIIKAAAFDRSTDSENTTGIFNYIYHPDKDQYLFARIKHGAASEATIDSLASHRCGKEVKGNSFIYRHFGTIEGQALFKKTVFSSNLKTLRYIFNGSEDITFRCASNGVDLENIGYEGFPDELRIESSKIPLHHVLVVDGVSVRKTSKNENGRRMTTDPSKILVSRFLDSPDNKDYLLDLLGCIPLSSDQHSYCHSLSSSDISFHTNLRHMPLHMASKEHFDRVAEKYKLDVTYEEFMYSLTFESLGMDREEIISRMKDYVRRMNFGAE